MVLITHVDSAVNMLNKNICHYCFNLKKIIKLYSRNYHIDYFPGLLLKSINSEFRKFTHNSSLLYCNKTELQCNQTNPNALHALANSLINNVECSDIDLNEKKDEVIKVLNFLVSKGCSITDIKEKYIQYLDFAHVTYAKIKLLTDIDSDVSMLIPLLSLSLPVLRIASNRARSFHSETKGFCNRISYLCHHLELSPVDLISLLTKHSSLLTMPFNRLDNRMHILKNAGIGSKYIVTDLWIFNYHEKLLATRVQAAEKAGVELKPWMLRCSKKFFVPMLLKYSETQRILSGEDEISYLAKKLDCKREYVEHMMEKNKSLKSINIPKLDQVINFLYEKGYTPQEVRLFPRVFCASISTLKKRYEEFSKIKITLPTISQLCMKKRTPVKKTD